MTKEDIYKELMFSVPNNDLRQIIMNKLSRLNSKIHSLNEYAIGVNEFHYTKIKEEVELLRGVLLEMHSNELDNFNRSLEALEHRYSLWKGAQPFRDAIKKSDDVRKQRTEYKEPLKEK